MGLAVLAAATMTAALFMAQPVQAVTAVVQPHSIVADTANGDTLVTTVARRGVAYRGRAGYRGRGVYRGGVFRGGVYRRGVYRGGVYRRPGLWYGATGGYYGGYGQPCGYAPYPPCATGYYGGVYRPGTGCITGKPALARLQELLRPAVVQALDDPFAPA